MRMHFVKVDLAVLAMTAGHGLLQPTRVPRVVAAQAAEFTAFQFFHEFYGAKGYTDPQVAQNQSLGMCNGVTFTPPVEIGMKTAAAGSNGLMLRLPALPAAAAMPADEIDRQRTALHALSDGKSPYYWNLMPEWDQSGGDWVSAGRPTYRALTRSAASSRLKHYYQNMDPTLGSYLSQPPGQRTYQLAAVTDYSPNVNYAYEMGVELQMLERGIDELGDLSTGIAFLRGAARQNGRKWGIDISAWRTGNNKATEYDDNGMLLGGWSADYLRRLFYISYMSGADVVHNEAVQYRSPNGKLTPFGQATKDFADFALRRHRDVGRTVTNTALLVPHDHGFDPKHGPYNQQNAVWYQDIPYAEGDYMVNNMLRAAYPNHWSHGLAPGAPFANSAGVPDRDKFRSYLAGGGDARPFEPMPNTRWGDNVDILTDHVSADVLAAYKVIVLTGDVRLSTSLRKDLTSFVQRGGTLVMFGGQATAADADLVGVTLEGFTGTASSSRWLDSAAGRSESSFSYVVAKPDGADVVAVAGIADPLITRKSMGDGEVYFVTALYGQATNRSALLHGVLTLLDTLTARYQPASVNGPAIEYIVNQGTSKVVVTLVNHAATEWSGEVVFQRPANFRSVTEYISDRAMAFTASDSNLTVAVRVAPYDIRVLAVE